MLDPKLIDEITKKLSQNLPEFFKELPNEAEKRVHEVIQAALAKLELVTREEFDVQTKVLNRTREKVEQLEAKVAELEAQIKQQ